MERVSPKPRMAVEQPVIQNSIEPGHLSKDVTDEAALFVLAHVGVPRVSESEWSLEVCGLVEKPLSLSLRDLKSYPQREIEAIHKCAGNPFEPTQPSRQIANVVWRGVDVRHILDDAGVDPLATHLWSYGLDFGDFFGNSVTHYVKDAPISRITQGDVLIAHTLNGAPLSAEHGFPARLVVPGFYGTNSVKWICRLEVADRRPEGLFTTQLYLDPDEGGAKKPVWEVEPESMFVFPDGDMTLNMKSQRVWGRAWSSCEVSSVEVSFDGGKRWTPAAVTRPEGRAWQTFSIDWQPPTPGAHRLLCRATDINGRTQPLDGARNSIYSVDVVIEAA